MRLRWLLLATVCVTGLTAAAGAAFSADADSQYTQVVHLAADLDRNGSVDSISIRFRPDPSPPGKGEWFDAFRVEIGEARLERHREGLKGTASVVDFDSTDAWLELAIPEDGPIDDDAVHFLRSTDGKLEWIGLVPGDSIRVDGSGVITTRCRGRTFGGAWWYPCEFRWSAMAGGLREVPQDFRPLTMPVKVKLDVVVQRSVINGSERFVIPAGTKGTIEMTDGIWYRLRTDSGRVGWFHAEGDRLYWENRDISEVFDGIPVAD